MEIHSPAFGPGRFLFFPIMLALGGGTVGAGPPSPAGTASTALMSDTETFPRLIAGPTCQKGEPPVDRVAVEVAGIEFIVRTIPPAEWEGRLQQRAAGMGPALRQHDGRPAPFQVFLLSIANRSPEMVRFQPGNVVRLLGTKHQDHPLDYTDLYRHLAQQGKDSDSLAEIRDEFFDSGIALPPGERVERLLFFRNPPEKGWKTLILLVSNFQVGTETLRVSLPFHLEKRRR